MTKLFWDVGGILGLWIGCSLITILEIIELGADLFLLFLHKKLKKQYSETLRNNQEDTCMSENNDNNVSRIQNACEEDIDLGNPSHNFIPAKTPVSYELCEPQTYDKPTRPFISRKVSQSDITYLNKLEAAEDQQVHKRVGKVTLKSSGRLSIASFINVPDQQFKTQNQAFDSIVEENTGRSSLGASGRYDFRESTLESRLKAQAKERMRNLAKQKQAQRSDDEQRPGYYYYVYNMN